MNKKIKLIITMICCLSIISGATLVTIAMDNNSKYKDDSKKPLNRGDDYEWFNISSGFNNKKIIDLITKRQKNDDKFMLVFDKQKFKNHIIQITQTAIGNFSRFKDHLTEYRFILNYQFINDFKIAIDLVWYLSNKNIQYFYYQFEFSLN